MTLFFSFCCLSICFIPSMMLFRRLIVFDPLRIILFVLGAFFWLLSLLFTSLLWTISTNLILTLIFSVFTQEIARAQYYFLLYKAQGGLTKLVSDGTDVSGFRLMFSSRHVLAIVCGLGMGVMASLFLLTNILADYSDDGVVGLPSDIFDNESAINIAELSYKDAYFPIYYSLSCAFLTLFNVLWTIISWDGYHKYFHNTASNLLVFSTFLITFIFHGTNTLLSIWQRSSPILVLIFQVILLFITSFYSACIIKNYKFLIFRRRNTADL